jgi:hypothetical protein
MSCLMLVPSRWPESLLDVLEDFRGIVSILDRVSSNATPLTLFQLTRSANIGGEALGFGP